MKSAIKSIIYTSIDYSIENNINPIRLSRKIAFDDAFITPILFKLEKKHDVHFLVDSNLIYWNELEAGYSSEESEEYDAGSIDSSDGSYGGAGSDGSCDTLSSYESSSDDE
jgi:hypothetical protein